MKRLTTDTPEGNLEASLNLFYIKGHDTWVRGGGPGPDFEDVNLSDFIRDVAKKHFPDIELPESNDDLIFAMAEWLMDGVDEPTGILALLYTAAWTYSELRKKLMQYEDTGMEPEDILSAKDMAKVACALHELNAYKDLGPIDHIRELVQAERAGRMIVLPEQGQTLYFIGRYNCEECPVESVCHTERGLDECPCYIATDIWKWDRSQEAGEGSQLEFFLHGIYCLTWEDAVEALKMVRPLICADCDFWSYADPRCMCGDSPWGGTRTRPDHSCSHLVPRGCAEETMKGGGENDH